MSSSFGRQITYSLFGESHGAGVGITIHHLPAGIKPDMTLIKEALERRRPGKHLHSSPRQENDQFQILSGLYDEVLTGAPLTVFFPNRDTRSKDYAESRFKPRPSHADFVAHTKFRGFEDFRGGGHFSARLTAPLVFAGALAAQILSHRGIVIWSYVSRVAEIKADALTQRDKVHVEALKAEVQAQDFPMLGKASAIEAMAVIESARMDRDSVGGQVKTLVCGVPVGLGEPFFDSLESTLAHLMFAIPAVKAIEFGKGVEFAKLKGSIANDPWTITEGVVQSVSNHSGGINGGISNGMPIEFQLTFRPTASISKEQDTVDLKTQSNATLQLQGRHDPCVLARACPIVEAMTAIGLLEAYLDAKGLEVLL